HFVTEADDESAVVRQSAIRALDEVRRTSGPDELGSAAEGRSRARLRARLVDEADEVWSLSAIALTGFGDPSAVPELLGIAMTVPRDIEAAEALADFVIGGSEAAEEIMARLRLAAGSPRMIERFRALQVLMEIPDGRLGAVTDLLVRLAHDENPEVAATAAAELRRRRSGPPRR